MSWTPDRGLHGIVCYGCRGRGERLGLHVSGVTQRFRCLDCDGTGRVKHCIACVGTGQLSLGEGAMMDCPECLGRGYPQPKRQYFTAAPRSG